MARKSPDKFQDVQIFSNDVFSSDLGSFHVNYKRELIEDYNFCQDSISKIFQAFTVKGMHFQFNGFEQAKLVSVIQGSLIDYFVDLRETSSTYLDYGHIDINDQNNLMILIPKGFAHGYITLQDNTYISYKMDNNYSKANEATLCWNDPSIGILWPDAKEYFLSEKDRNGMTLLEIQNLLGHSSKY